MVLGVLLLVSAVGLLAYNRWDDQRAGQSVAQIEEALEAALEDETTVINVRPATVSEDTTEEPGSEPEEPVTAEPAEQEPEEETGEIQVVEIDGYEYVGTLSIPSLEMSLPVMYEWSYDGLKIAPGRYSGSVLTDDLIICGHNYSNHFGNIKYLAVGSALTFTDVAGNTYDYEVVEVVTLQPTAIEEMLDQTSSQWDLTLFTCTTGGQTRVTVRCSWTE